MAKQKQKIPFTRKPSNRTMTDVRDAINVRLKAIGKTRNWLAVTTGIRVATVYDFLAGKQDIMLASGEAMMRAVGLAVAPAPDTIGATIAPGQKPSKRR